MNYSLAYSSYVPAVVPGMVSANQSRAEIMMRGRPDEPTRTPEYRGTLGDMRAAGHSAWIVRVATHSVWSIAAAANTLEGTSDLPGVK